MSLSSGTRIGVYEIVSPLGAGGMGEVYRARDTKLGRDVAIKVLPSAFTADPERLARFEREARLLASLNHPNIGAIYGLEDTAGIVALVLELVEGETLAERIAKGTGPRAEGRALPLAEALDIARQIADALDAAHEGGIVHRDLKPANIKITPDGVVKVLDFGLAKSGAGQAGGAGGDVAQGFSPADLTHSPTVMAPTLDGVLLGTAPYMSPEQARGKAVDKRTDIWAFGCVLYEMLTGARAFPGETMSDTIAAILERMPDMARLPGSLPPSIHRLLHRCLDKDQRRRLRDIGDAHIELDEAIAGASDVVVAGAQRLAARSVQFQRLTDFVGLNESPSVSPDGKMIAFVALAGGKRQIWIRLLAGGVPLQVTRDDAHHEQPRWAPDSSTLVYYSPSTTPGEQGTVWEVSALGGHPRPIAPALAGADVSHDGRRIALFQCRDGRIELAILTRDGASLQRHASLPAGQLFLYPRWSPDDRWLAFQVASGYFAQHLCVMPADGGESQPFGVGIMKGLSWLPDGLRLVYSSSSGSTMLYPPTFNLRVVARDGSGDRPVTFGDMSYTEPDVHESGRLFACRIRSQSDVWRFPVTGTPEENTREGERITRQTGQVQTVSTSPDGKEVVYLSDNGGHGNLWVARTDGSSVRQITFERDANIAAGVAVWSPAGHRIVFLRTTISGNATSLWLINSDGSGTREAMAPGLASGWSGDGQWLYYTPTFDTTSCCLMKWPVNGGPAVLVRDEAVFLGAMPDGSGIFYARPLRTELGEWHWEIRKAFPETGPSHLLAHIAGSRIPVSPVLVQFTLSPDGKDLATPLVDGATTNLWALPTDGSPMRQLTDFGERPITIARRISWSPDNKCLYAAVAETGADVVLLDGLLP